MKEAQMSKIVITKDLSRLGDVIINYVSSVALTLYHQKVFAIKVPNKLLSRASRLASLELHIKMTSKKANSGDLAEALIAYAWLNSLMSTNEMINILIENLRKTGSIEEAIAFLLDAILKRIQKH
ncbi:MAG TPA: hypothetical protein ENF53_01645 [Thermoprotei archaeon]|nr:hypothetical protein [Thermoprotei archaeon]